MCQKFMSIYSIAEYKNGLHCLKIKTKNILNKKLINIIKNQKINDLKLDFENFYDYCNSELEAKSAKVKLLDKEYKNREMVRKEQLNR